MIKTNITQLKTINFFIFTIFFLSCSSLKNDKFDDKFIVNSIDNFIENYTLNIKEDNLKAIIIQKKDDGSNESYVIMDVPIDVIYGTINEKKSKYKISIYKGIFCQYLPQDIVNNSFIFNDIAKNDIAKINKNQTIKIGDKDLTLNNTYINWESNIEITYNLKTNIKEIKILGNKASVIVR